MDLKTFRRVAGTVKALFGVVGAGVVVTMGALVVASGGDEFDVSTARPNDLPIAPSTSATTPRKLATPFASPTHIATPCAKRATLPC